MKKLIYLLILLLIFIILFAVVTNTDQFFLNIINTLNLWLTKVYPSIFTYYLISSLLLNTNLLNKIIYLFRNFFKRLKFKNDLSLNIFILSIFTGNPTSSGIIIENIRKNNLLISEANDLLKVSAFINPLFILAFLSPFSIKYAYIMIFVHIASNFLLVKWVNKDNPETIISNPRLKFSIKDILNSINNCIQILLIVSAMMVFANIITFSINHLLSTFQLNILFLKLILTQFEVTTGLNYLLSLKLNLFLTYLFIAFTISFNGLSIHLQVLNIISSENLKYKNFFCFRILQGLISMLILTFFIMIEKSL